MQISILSKLKKLAATAIWAGAVGLTAFVQPSLFAPTAEAAKDAELTPEDLTQVNKVSGFFNGFQTLTGQFAQVGPRGNVSNGVFYISKPGKMRFEYNPPSPYLIVSDGTWVVIKNKKNQRTDHYPLSATPLKLVLSNQVDLAKQAKILNVRVEGGSIVLTLADKNRAVPGQLALIYSEEKATIEQWTVIDGEGRRTTISLTGISAGAQHDASLFKVKRPRKSKANDDNR